MNSLVLISKRLNSLQESKLFEKLQVKRLFLKVFFCQTNVTVRLGKLWLSSLRLSQWVASKDLYTRVTSLTGDELIMSAFSVLRTGWQNTCYRLASLPVIRNSCFNGLIIKSTGVIYLVLKCVLRSLQCFTRVYVVCTSHQAPKIGF